MKKRMLLLMIFALALILGACGGDGSATQSTAPTTTAHVHSYESKVTEPTCTEGGYTTYTCACGDTYTDSETAALGHTYESKVTEPACTEGGYTTHTCACGDTYTDSETAPLGHTYESAVTAEPTCTSEGCTTYTCACGDSYTEPISMLAHTLGEWQVTQPHSCTDDELSMRSCTVCAFEETCVSKTACHIYDSKGLCVCGRKVSVGLKYTQTETGYEVAGIGTCKDTKLVIPEMHEGLPVVAIGEGAFQKNKKITSVTLPETVISIGSKAFQECTALAKVQMAEGLEAIGDYAFYKCSVLTALVLPDTVTVLGSNALDTCKKLTDITFGKGLSKVGMNAFKDCTGLKNVHISDLAAWCTMDFNNLIGYESNPLHHADDLYVSGELATALVLPEDVTEICDEAFMDYAKLKSITISANVTKIGYSAFKNCTGLTEIRFGGTMEQWEALEKGSAWNRNTGSYRVICTDGEVEK